MSEQLFSYVVVFDKPEREAFTAAIDRYSQVIPNWYAVLPHAVFVVSSLTAAKLTDFIRKNVPDVHYILVLRANSDRNGWLPKKAWEFLRSPGEP